MTSGPEVVATGIQFGEGPVWCPARGTEPASLVCTAVAAGAVERVDLATGRITRVADLGGGANAAVLATDGGFLVTQNGGIDFSQTGLYPDPPPYRPVTPCLQRVHADGHVDDAVAASSDDGPFRAPNDLVVDRDGSVWFTDPPHHPPPPEPLGRVHVLSTDGTTRVVARDFHYCNGIALEPDGTPVVIEAIGLLRLARDGTREWIRERLSPSGSAGDGLCVDEAGRFYVANTADHGIRVLDRDGGELDFLEIPGQGVTTNCCFGGDDGRTLFATDGVPGQVLAWEGMPTPGLAVHAWPVPGGPG
ncbi:MAG TPA: SMP-30/gluconolactonase/LRE family protein [Acidimicrobiia bacterium]